MDPILESTETIAVASHPRMSWGAVIAGWSVAVGVASLFYVVGLAVGFSALDPEHAASTTKGLGIGTAVWIILSWVASLFLGGMFASWFDGKNDSTMGTLHGVTVWGLAVVMSGLLLSIGLGHAINGAALFGDHARTSQTSLSNSRALPDTPAVDAEADVQAKLEWSAHSNASGAMAANGTSGQTPPVVAMHVDHEAMAAATAALLSSHPQTAKDILMAHTAMTPGQVDDAVTHAMTRVEQYQTEMQALAKKAAKYTSVSLWVMFLSAFLGLLAAALGGCLGAVHIHRVYHLRTYRPLTKKHTVR